MTSPAFHNPNRDSRSATGADEAWSRPMIERYCDGDLPAQQAELIDRDLAASPRLKRRIARVREFDALIARALSSQPGSVERARQPRRGRTALALCALAVTAATLLTVLRPAPTSTPPEHGVAAGSAPDSATVVLASRSPEPVSRVRVIFSIPLGDAVADSSNDSDDPPSNPPSGESPSDKPAAVAQAAIEPERSYARNALEAARARAIAQLDEALARGDLVAGSLVIVQADRAERSVLFGRLGRVPLSATSAAKLLDLLPGDVAVELCQSWLRDGQQRPMALKHLKARAQDGALRDHVHVAVRRLLDENPQLRPWIVSYANWAIATDAPAKDKNGARADDPLTTATATAVHT